MLSLGEQKKALVPDMKLDFEVKNGIFMLNLFLRMDP